MEEVLRGGRKGRKEPKHERLSGLLTGRGAEEAHRSGDVPHSSRNLPVWQSSMLLRSELDRFHRELEKHGRHENLHRIILVGHSMGGLISILVVRNPGESFWAALSDTPIEELDLSPDARRMITDMVKFKPRTDIARVIYVTTPHWGSPIPHNPIIDRAIRFIQMPRTISRRDRRVLVGGNPRGY